MSYTSVLPYFLFSTIYLLLSAWLVKGTQFYTMQTAQSIAGRFDTLDGLRGFLALGVFFHHSLIYFFYYGTSKWDAPPSHFYNLLGQAAVTIFFMITGFLFTDKVITSGGPLDIQKFYVSRIRRLVPMYVVSAVLLLILVIIATHGHLNVDLRELLRQVAAWFMFGLSGFQLQGMPDINGFKDTFRIESVYWTLRFEWLFYLALPLLSLFAGRKFKVCLSVMLLYCLLFHDYFTINFVWGSLAASLARSPSLRKLCQMRRYTIIPLLALLHVFMRFDTSYKFAPSLFLFVFFLFIACGNDLYGLLKQRSAMALGAMSYSLYLLHSPLLFFILKAVNHFHPITALKPGPYWLIIGLTGGILIALSSLTYRYIECRYYEHKKSRDSAHMGAIEGTAVETGLAV